MGAPYQHLPGERFSSRLVALDSHKQAGVGVEAKRAEMTIKPGTALKYLVVVVGVAVVTLFVLQNTAATSLRFLTWTLGGVPVGSIVLAALVVGMILVGAPLSMQCSKLRAETYVLRARLAQFDAWLKKADRPASLRVVRRLDDPGRDHRPRPPRPAAS
jgi:uncharacterized integral membrane protein